MRGLDDEVLCYRCYSCSDKNCGDAGKFNVNIDLNNSINDNKGIGNMKDEIRNVEEDDEEVMTMNQITNQTMNQMENSSTPEIQEQQHLQYQVHLQICNCHNCNYQH